MAIGLDYIASVLTKDDDLDLLLEQCISDPFKEVDKGLCISIDIRGKKFFLPYNSIVEDSKHRLSEIVSKYHGTASFV